MRKIAHLIGAGGIGSGVVYAVDSNADLGRNESRLAHRLDQRDYCKLHIIFHYLATVGREAARAVIPIGAVGDDEPGRELLRMMGQAGMILDHVQVVPDCPTLFSVCWQFPDASGGNLTESQSASSRVTPADVEAIEPLLQAHGSECLALAVPEAPMATRRRLLELGRQHGAFTAASFVSEEIRSTDLRDWLPLIDLLAVNIDEAAGLAGIAPDRPPEEIARACRDLVAAKQPQLHLSITNGGHGAYACAAGKQEALPALNVKAENTGGAGDASFAGLILGLLEGLPFADEHGPSAAKIGRQLAAMSVTSPDTIHTGIDRESLAAFASEHGRTPL